MLGNKLKKIMILSITIISLLILSSLSLAQVEPLFPQHIEVEGNQTITPDLGFEINGTRGYIYNLTINQSQQSYKWAGYVGTINSEFALMDASGASLYNWPGVVTTTGEVYATKMRTHTCQERAGGLCYIAEDPYSGGIPEWSNMRCANQTMLNGENELWDHGTAEDSLNRTFSSEAEIYNHTDFFVGTTFINDSEYSCKGIHLNVDDERQLSNWRQVALTDGRWAVYDGEPGSDTVYHSTIYAALIEPEGTGFDGGMYNFQMILPQIGTSGDQPVIPYYFYVELI